ncbi:MAG: FAD-dependent oxidoreductase [Kiritimatiellae bacterium]|nr:FAD-dependent oxidoreductase [Kiritimatiellia bacterium]
MKYTIKRLLGFVGKYRYPAILTIICMIGEVIFEVLIPKYMALLIDNGIGLGDTGYVYRMGGVMTDGLIDSYCYGLRIGFTVEIDRGTAALGAKVHGVGKAEWFRREARAAGAEIWFGAVAAGLEKSSGSVSKVIVAFADGSCGSVAVKCAVDATGNADLAAMAGEPTEFIDAAELSLQGAGSTAKVLGRSYMNTDCGFVDDTDAEDLMNFTLRARQSMGAYAWDQSQIVNSRERRRMHGVAYITPQDVIMNRTYPDVFARARSNFDTHGQTVGGQFFIEAPHAEKPITVNLPYRCILPKNTDGLLVIGLGMSAHRDAMPILRMQPDVQNQGFAAGTAAAMAVAAGVPPRAIDVGALQRKLIAKGILDDSVLSMKDSFPLSDETLARAAATLDDGYRGLAELLTDPARAVPLLKRNTGLPSAHVLAMLGDGSKAPQLAEAVATSKWDGGWNYRGMDQFGRSVSWVDSYLIALGRARAKCAVRPLLEKIAALPAGGEYSHFRAVALCAEGVGCREAVPALAALLAKPGVGGHAQRPVMEAGVAPIPEYAYWQCGNRGMADRERSDCLKELCIARALFNLGDSPDRAGERALRRYAADPRRAYANHAKKVLEAKCR